MSSKDNTSPPPYEASPPDLPQIPSMAANSQRPTRPNVYFLTTAFIPSGNPNVYASTNTNANDTTRNGSVLYVPVLNNNQTRRPNPAYIQPNSTSYTSTNTSTTTSPNVIVNVNNNNDQRNNLNVTVRRWCPSCRTHVDTYMSSRRAITPWTILCSVLLFIICPLLFWIPLVFWRVDARRCRICGTKVTG